jgi:hypothetical protein
MKETLSKDGKQNDAEPLVIKNISLTFSPSINIDIFS